MKTIAILLLGTMLVPAAAAAQETDFDLGTIVVTPNKIKTEAKRTGTAVTVVTEDQLKNAGDVSVSTYLSRLPGVTVTQTGPFGSAANLRIRGADQRYIAVYIDGIRVGDPSLVQTGFDFGALMTADITRIEVLRGSQSALYGGSAVGGVISITTRDNIEEGTHQYGGAEIGTYNSVMGNYTLTQKTGPFQAALSFTALHTDGFSAVTGGKEADGGDATRLSFTTAYDISDNVVIGGSAFTQRTYQEFDGYNPSTFVLEDQNNTQTRVEGGARVYTDITDGATVHHFELQGYRVTRDFKQVGGNSNYEGERQQLQYQGTTTVSPELTLVYGADTSFEQAKYSNLTGGKADTRISGIYAQGLWSPTDDLDISLTAREDDNSSFGTFPTGRLSVAWQASDTTTLRGVIAKGFRAPSLDELYGNYPGFFPFVGNPNLTPEESMSYELGIDQEFGSGGTLSATLFKLDIDNLITYQPGTPATLVNLPGTSIRQGIEFGATVPLSDNVTLGAAYTYTDAQDASGARLGLIPKNDLTLTLDAQMTDRINGGVVVHYVVDRLDDFATSQMPDYTTVAVRMGYAINDNTEAYVRVENLFDEQYELVPGFATSGRAIYAGLRATF